MSKSKLGGTVIVDIERKRRIRVFLTGNAVFEKRPDPDFA